MASGTLILSATFSPAMFSSASGPLASGSFSNRSLDWQIQKFFQRLGEGIESWFSNRVSVPDNPLPAWFLQGLFWLVAISLIAWASWQLYRLLQPYWQQADQQPVATQQSVADWLKQAKAAQEQSNYQAACRALYMAALQRLSEQGLIPEQLSRTDGEYLALLRSLSLAPPAQAPYQTLIGIHERLYFDRVTASAELYDRCWQAYQQLEQVPIVPPQTSSASQGSV
jgi:Domain of unknown function (DUF4129)